MGMDERDEDIHRAGAVDCRCGRKGGFQVAEDRSDAKGETLADKLIAKCGDRLRKVGEGADLEEAERIFQEFPE